VATANVIDVKASRRSEVPTRPRHSQRGRTTTGARRPAITTLAVLACCALGALIALRHLGTKPLWLDEAASVSAAGRSIPDMLRLLRHTDANSGLYYVMLHVWMRFGHGVAWVRGLSVLFAVAAVAAAGWCGARWRGPVAGVSAALLLALNPVSLYYAQEARTYSLALLLALVSTATLMAAVERPDRLRLAAYAVATTLLLYADLFAVLFVASQVAVLAWRGRKHRLAPALAAVAVCTAPLALWMIANERHQIWWIQRPTPSDLLHTVLAYSGHWLGLGAIVVAGIAAVRARQARDRLDFTYPLVAAALVPIAALWLVSLGPKHFFVDRYLIASLAAIVLVAGAGLAVLYERRTLRAAGVILAVALLAFVLFDLHMEHEPFKHEDGRSAANYIDAQDGPGDAVLYSAWGFRVVVAPLLPPPGRPGHPTDVALNTSNDADRLGLLYPTEVSDEVLAARLRSAQRIWVVGHTGPPRSDDRALPTTVAHRLRMGAPKAFGDLTVTLWSAASAPRTSSH
jgi:mannosyltransferase